MAVPTKSVRVKDVHAVEIIDSDGLPALEVRMTLAGGATGSACVPFGANPPAELAGILDAAVLELGDAAFDGLADLDGALGKLADSGIEPRPGPDALRGVSIAAARALAARQEVPLWQLLALPGTEQRLPVPQFTVVNGGSRAATALDFEEFMIVPIGAPSMRDAVRAAARLRARLRAQLIGSALGSEVGEDGGFTPAIEWPERVLELIAETIADAGYALGADGVALALRVAASGFRHDGGYRMAGEWLSSADMVARYEEMIADFPLCSIEDALAQDDWDGWAELTRRLGDRVQLVGGDVFATDPELIAAESRSVANAALIKVAEFGTVTEILNAMRACRAAGYAQVLAHRGATSDAFVADLAVGAGCGQLRAGAPTRGERVANYNRLIEIEAEDQLPYRI
ncbi:phosphopyruvate hydratase [Actinocrinis sp.]|uniref:phosphopyruvate hydratase n=1 Tax=Actinocrinis sp. TaxID=1920516 RepID=UPI002C2EEFF5|nr:phosphopyruvate hydratase [Actinocrinis sp.]HXR70436.1 phosphopyruvate hydratase [Actinocrinis sp.]